MFQQTIDFADTLTSRENIIIIKSVSNPYAILKKCDYFVLSSFMRVLVWFWQKPIF